MGGPVALELARPVVALLRGSGGIGASDCERIRDGFLAQPANTISSFAYVLVAIWVVWRFRELRGTRRLLTWVYGIVLALVGLGSVAFHGPMPAWAKLAHDLPITGILLIVIAVGIIDAAPGFRFRVLGILALAVVGVGVVFSFFPDASLGLTGAIAVAAITGEILRLRRFGRWSSRRLRRRVGAALGVLVLAEVANALGRTGAPLCRPDSLLQLHALWHVLSAVAFGVWSLVLFEPGETRT